MSCIRHVFRDTDDTVDYTVRCGDCLAHHERDEFRRRVAELEELVDRWKASAMLVDGGGDPDGITPEHNERNVTSLEAERDAQKARADRAEAACAAIREYIEEYILETHRADGDPYCSECQAESDPVPGGVLLNHAPDCRFAAALAVNAGRGWLSPTDAEALRRERDEAHDRVGRSRQRESEMAMAIGLDGWEYGAADVRDRFLALRRERDRAEVKRDVEKARADCAEAAYADIHRALGKINLNVSECLGHKNYVDGLHDIGAIAHAHSGPFAGVGWISPDDAEYLRQELAEVTKERDAADNSVDWLAAEGDRLRRGRVERQKIVAQWCTAAFGHEHTTSIPQRAVRLLEEAIEAYQAAGGSVEMAHSLIDYIFARPVGELAQELGGIGVTLLALANAAGLSADDEEAKEVDRVLSKPLEHFTARNRVKDEAGFVVKKPSTK